MARKHDIKNICLTISDIIFFEGGLSIQWTSTIGFGEYTIYKENNELKLYSECMDCNKDKAFLEELLKKASEYILNNGIVTG